MLTGTETKNSTVSVISTRAHTRVVAVVSRVGRCSLGPVADCFLFLAVSRRPFEVAQASGAPPASELRPLSMAPRVDADVAVLWVSEIRVSYLFIYIPHVVWYEVSNALCSVSIALLLLFERPKVLIN